METVEVIAMIYKSPSYLKFITSQLERHCASNIAKVSWRIVGNDPTDEIQTLLEEGSTPFSIFHDHHPDDHYLARVYRCWNYCVESSKADLVVLVNSDMAFSPGWLDPLIEAYHAHMIPVSRLVESGKLLSGLHCVQTDFGKSPDTFDESSWLQCTEKLIVKETHPGGMFMPVLFDRNEFLATPGYPSGNVNHVSGDAFFFVRLAAKTQRQHVTCFDSLVYHIQEGEKDE